MSFFSRKIPKFNVMDINMIILHLRACWGTMDMLILNFNVEKKAFTFYPLSMMLIVGGIIVSNQSI